MKTYIVEGTENVFSLSNLNQARFVVDKQLKPDGAESNKRNVNRGGEGIRKQFKPV